MFILRFPNQKISYWASRYENSDEERNIQNTIAPKVQAAGYYSQAEFLDLCKWKTPRSAKHCQKNSKEFIKTITQTAFSTTCERLRIEILTLLDGVGWPTASALLHFGHKNAYPILDYRALWSLGIDKLPNKYAFDFWWAYTEHCRKLAKKEGVSMRKLDRALWQYSKKNQANSG